MKIRFWLSAIAMTFVVAGCGGGGASSSQQETEATEITPIRANVVVTGDFQGTAMIGESYVGEISVVAEDARNTITGITVENPTIGGSSPVVNAEGKLVWTPAPADFATRELKLSVTSVHGGQTTLVMPARVSRKQVIHRIVIDAGEGNYSDPDGDFLIRVSKDDSASLMAGTILVVQRQTNDGGQGFEYEVEDGRNYNIEVLEQPGYQSTPIMAISTQSTLEDLSYSTLPHTIQRHIGSFINKGKNIWTLRQPVQKNAENKQRPSYFDLAQISALVSSCSTDCKAAKYTKAPFVLMHGFHPGGLLGDYGGGAGTWGELPATLIAKGHPVFEVRWRTYIRFEEAAFLLKLAVEEASVLTGAKPVVVAHSFGGIVAHLAAQGHAENYRGSWYLAPTDQIAKIITINSPLSGISGDRVPYLRQGFSLAAGRDADDFSIATCKSVTCFQAGEPVSIEDSLAYLGLTADSLDKAGYMPARGSAIEKLQRTSTPVPYHVIVGLNDEVLRETNAVMDSQGDGLISLLGQAKNPEDFVDDPYDGVAQRTGTSYPFKSLSVVRAFNTHPIGSCLKFANNNVDYRLCRQSAHTNFQKNTGILDFGAAYYESNPHDFPSQGVNHPLHDILVNSVSSDYLPGAVVTSCDGNRSTSVCKPKWEMKGQVKFGSSFLVTQSTSPAANVFMWLTYENKETAQVFRDFSAQTGADGFFSVDLGTPLRERAGIDVNPGNYRVKLTISVQGYETYRETIEDLVQGDNQLAAITLTPKQANAVNITGKVIDAQTVSTGIGSAVVRLAQGSDLDANTIRIRTDVVNVNTLTNARKLTTGSDGSFSAQGLRPGIYSVLVSKAGYVEQPQGRVTVSSGGNISLSMLKTPLAGENSITLRWDNGSAGAAVARDLDSHLLRLNGSQVDYHIYYSQRTTANSSDSLDRDDTDYEGPETITFSPATGRDFVYYVHNFSGGATNIVDSRARVTLRFDGRALQFSPPVAGISTARYWRVFDIVNGTIVRCVNNCLQDAVPTGLATQSGYVGIPAPWRSSLTQLPAKH